MENEEITWAEIKNLFVETDKRIEKRSELTEKRFRETDEKFKETDEKFKETDEKFKETRLGIEELKQQIQKTESMFTSQWGKLIESLVSGDLVKLLNERDIPVRVITERFGGSFNGHNFEYDIIAVNGPSVVVIEVKSTLKPKHIREFIPKLTNFKTWTGQFIDKALYGGVAFLKADAGAEIMAQKKGLYVIRATGDSAAIINPKEFVPREF